MRVRGAPQRGVPPSAAAVGHPTALAASCWATADELLGNTTQQRPDPVGACWVLDLDRRVVAWGGQVDLVEGFPGPFDHVVESDRGAVPAFRLFRFPGPLP